jgi:hypothetical protein
VKLRSFESIIVASVALSLLINCSGKAKVSASLAPSSVLASATQSPQPNDSARAPDAVSSARTRLTPSPAPTREVYRIDEVRKLRAGRLNRTQIAWMKTIVEDGYWQARLGASLG